MEEQKIQKEIKDKIFDGARWVSLCWIWMFMSLIFSPLFRTDDHLDGKKLPIAILYLSLIFAPQLVKLIPRLVLLLVQGGILVGVSLLLTYGTKIVFLMAGLPVLLFEELIFIAPPKKVPLISLLYGAFILANANNLMSFILQLEAFAIVFVLVVIAYRTTYRQFMQAEELRVVNEKLNHANQRIEKLTAERVHKEVARDLHDTLTQDFVGLNMRLTVIKQLAEKQEYAKLLPMVTETQQMATNAIEQSRSMIKQYRDLEFPREKQSLKQMTLDTIALLEENYSLKTKLTINQDVAIWMGELVDIERVVSEALMNVVKHGETDQAAVNMVVDDNQLTIEIINHGKNWQPTNRDNHYGMTNMKERAAKYNGEIKFSSLAKGLKVTATFELGEN
ncbi:sensor histidine kinase [Limosilactobacillus caccae]|uniref:sensor histidine kinase n=1 Tax=Limosilactobacillus caccae TaxID=1926284 RepID=UPI00117997D3|nr:histidine kinase [Limosilactobacillus caccae]